VRAASLLLVVVLVACGEDGARVDEIEVGMCFDDQDGSAVEHLPTRPCDEPHENEVFHLFDVDGETYPGQDALTADADAVCRGDAFTTYVGQPVDQSRFEVYQILPSEDSWGRGDREVACVLYDPVDNTETGSARLAPA
jgi:hypothetical protein